MSKAQTGTRVQFKCQETGCNATVVYERKTAPGAFKLRKAMAGSSAGVSVYLTCEYGHVHRYEIPGSGAKGPATHGG